MATYITIDGGTTNTRIGLVKDSKLIDIVKLNVGAGSGKEALKAAVKNAIDEIMSRNADVPECILASGMITSEYGLVTLSHITAPAGIEELHNSLEKVVLSEISNIPFYFIRGVKTECDNLEYADMMRGEETEVMGILSGDGVYILPGSHSKIITVKNGKILEFSTHLTGEMAKALSENTILKDAIVFCDETDDEYLLNGFDCCRKLGINEALFKVRILKNIFKCNEKQLYSFFMGIILKDEIEVIVKKQPVNVTIGGRKQFKEAIAKILEKRTSINVNTISEEAVEQSSFKGMVKVYEC